VEVVYSSIKCGIKVLGRGEPEKMWKKKVGTLPGVHRIA